MLLTCTEVVAFKTIQLGRRMSCEMLRSFGIIEEDPLVYMPLRRMREEWLVRNIEAAEEADPTDATMKHKTTCTWQLRELNGCVLVAPQVVASGTPMSEPIRFVPCVVEHSRSNDAEFQVLNKAADTGKEKKKVTQSVEDDFIDGVHTGVHMYVLSASKYVKLRIIC